MTGSDSDAAAASGRREQQRRRWAQAVIGDPTVTLQRASVDAGFRSYWRVATGTGSRIVMDAPPDTDDVRPWLRMRDLLSHAGVRVPAVLARDVESGFLLLEDLGVDTYLQALDDDNADRMFDAAVTQLLRLQAIAVPDGQPAYDETFLLRELRLFDDWYLGRHLGVTLDCDDLECLGLVYRRLLDNLLAQRQILVHRDFMPRNLMPLAGQPRACETLVGQPLEGRAPVDPLHTDRPRTDQSHIDQPDAGRQLAAQPLDAGPAVLDFQDAVRGPVAYDAASLFRDAFRSWPEPRVDGWLRRYHARAVTAGVPVPVTVEWFLRDADFASAQRNLKILGIFARLHHRDGKSKYLADAPRFIAYLDTVISRHEALAPLGTVLDRHVRPALAAAVLAAADAPS